MSKKAECAKFKAGPRLHQEIAICVKTVFVFSKVENNSNQSTKQAINKQQEEVTLYFIL